MIVYQKQAIKCKSIFSLQASTGGADVGLSSLLNASTEIRVDSTEHVVCRLADTLVGAAEVDRDVVNEGILLAGLTAQDLPETVGLNIIFTGDGQLLDDHGASPLLVFLAGLDGLVADGTEGRGVVGVGTVVAVNVHVTITVSGVEGAERAVHRDLFVVAAQTVTVGIGVGEEAGLQHGVGGGLNTGNHVGRREGSLLDLGEVVLRVLVQGEAAKATQWNLALRPHLGQVEDIPTELLGLLGAEDLHVTGPGGVLAALNCVEQILGVPVGVLGSQAGGLLVVEGLVSLVGLEMDLNVVESAVRLDPLVGVAGVAVHVAVGVRRTTVTEEVHDLMDGLVVGGEIIPEHGGILQVGLGVTLLSVDEDGELGRVAKEEDGGVVEDPVPVALLGVELDGEATGITGTVGGTLLTTDGREAHKGLGLLANTLEHVNGGDVTDVVGDLEFTVGTGTLGVDDTLGDSLAVKVGQQIDQVEVLKEQRTITTNPLGGLRVKDGAPIGGSVGGVFVVAVGL